MDLHQLQAKTETLLALLRGEIMPGLTPDVRTRRAIVQARSILWGLAALSEEPTCPSKENANG